MAAEFEKLTHILMKNGHGPAAHELAALELKLSEQGAIPDNLHDGNCMKPEEALGEWLARLTKKRKMSQRQLAHRAGVDHTSISRIFKEKRTPSLPVFTGIVVALGINPETVFKVMETVSSKELGQKS